MFGEYAWFRGTLVKRELARGSPWLACLYIVQSNHCIYIKNVIDTLQIIIKILLHEWVLMSAVAPTHFDLKRNLGGTSKWLLCIDYDGTSLTGSWPGHLRTLQHVSPKTRSLHSPILQRSILQHNFAPFGDKVRPTLASFHIYIYKQRVCFH